MDESSIIHHLTTAFDDVRIETADGSSFFFTGEDRKLPFATLVTKDNYDKVSNLGRPGIFRLNIGIGKKTFLALFGPPPSQIGAAEPVYDFTALNQVMPHPVYGAMFWVCVLNPSDATFTGFVKPLLAEAWQLAAGKRQARDPER